MEIVCPARIPGVEKLIHAIPTLADQGVTAIELRIGNPLEFDHRDAFEVQVLISELSAYGIRIHSVHAPFGPGYDISSPDDSIHERGVDALIEAIELASLMDVQRVIVHASDKFPNSVNRRFERARGVLREVASIAKESDAVLAVENLPPGYLAHTPDELFALLEGIDRDSVGICFDSGHANLSGNFCSFAEALLPYAVVAHVHDNDGMADQHRFPGEGIIDWHAFAATYRSTGCEASITLECALPEDLIWSEAFQRLRCALGD